MKSFFEIKNGGVVACPPEGALICVYAQPGPEEKTELMNNLGLNHHAIESALDPDEVSRVEANADHLYLIWKRPNTASFKDQLKFGVSSLGLFLRKNQIILILSEDGVDFTSKEFRDVFTLNDFVLKFLLQTIHHFLGHLKAMRMLNAELQSKLNNSMENRYLFQMFNLSESLIYYLNALEANASALGKLRSTCERLNFTKTELDLLDDIMIEHQQCSRQTQIYSSVLSDLMDARGNIINNNMNILLKNLTLINIVFLPLNLLASIGGMSEYTRITEHFIDWRIAYSLFILAMIVLGILTWVILVKQVNRQKIGNKQPENTIY